MNGDPVFERPVFILGPPRSGTTLLFDLLRQAPELWSLGCESHAVIETIAGLHPRTRGWESNCLTAADADPATVETLVCAFAVRVRDRDGKWARDKARLRLLEKTPRNCLRVPFFAAAFPDALFLYLYRDPRETVSSMLEAWRSPGFIAYHDLPGWPGPGPSWSLLLVPGWRELAGRDVAEIAARQWAIATSRLLDDLEALAPDRWRAVSFERLIADPQSEIEQICEWVGVPWDRVLSAPLRHSRTALTPPAPGKWRRNAEDLARVMPLIDAVAERAVTKVAREGAP